jgi:hypothetical protein
LIIVIVVILIMLSCLWMCQIYGRRTTSSSSKYDKDIEAVQAEPSSIMPRSATGIVPGVFLGSALGSMGLKPPSSPHGGKTPSSGKTPKASKSQGLGSMRLGSMGCGSASLGTMGLASKVLSSIGLRSFGARSFQDASESLFSDIVLPGSTAEESHQGVCTMGTYFMAVNVGYVPNASYPRSEEY